MVHGTVCSCGLREPEVAINSLDRVPNDASTEKCASLLYSGALSDLLFFQLHHIQYCLGKCSQKTEAHQTKIRFLQHLRNRFAQGGFGVPPTPREV